MVRHAPSLARLASALLLLAAGCSHAPAAPPRPTLAQLEARCAPAWKAAHGDIDTKGAACSADWECRQVWPEYLGCDAWANVGFKLGEGRLVELESACAPISFVPDCGERIGACAAGRCIGRRPRPDRGICLAARSELTRKTGSPAACRSSADCEPVTANGLLGVSASGWRERHAAEVRAIADACTLADLDPNTAYRPAECVQGVCALAPVDWARSAAAPGTQDSSPPVKYTRPVELEKGCVARSIRLPASFQPYQTSLHFRFRLSKRGIPYGFEILDTDRVTPPGFERVAASRRTMLVALGEAVSQCAFAPGQVGDGSTDVFMVLPIRFADR